MSDIPLDETALQAALDRGDKLYEEREAYLGREDVETMARREVGALISAYLAAARFELETRYKTISAKDGLSDPEQRPVGPWVPVVQAESEE